MAKQTLPTNYKDDILASSMGGKRKYRLINNSDGTVSLEDVTTYDQNGSEFKSGDINNTNTAVNASMDASKLIDSLGTVAATTQAGFPVGALAVKELNGKLGGLVLTAEGSGSNVKYYAQIGADSASKKRLGSISDVFSMDTYSGNLNNFTNNADHPRKCVICYYQVARNNYHSDSAGYSGHNAAYSSAEIKANGTRVFYKQNNPTGGLQAAEMNYTDVVTLNPNAKIELIESSSVVWVNRYAKAFFIEE